MQFQQIDCPQNTRTTFAASQRPSSLPYNLPPRALNRRAAAEYVDLSASKFDELVKDGRMPQPKVVDRRKMWDVHALDLAFDALSTDGEKSGSTWDDLN